MADDIELYDIPPVFQNRMLKWLGKHDERLTISVVDDKFLVTPRDPRRGSSEHKSLEHALNHAMGSRAETGHIRTRFATRVKKWLAAERALLSISANGDLFGVELHGDGAVVRDEDEDLEVALVLAEEQYGATEAPGSRAETVAAPTLRDIEPMTLEAPTRYDVEPETEEAPTRFRIGEDERTVREAGLTENAKWSRAYVNSLPDSAFLHVEPGGRRDRLGRSHPLTLRHLPYKNRSGRIDKAHLRAAMSRAHQEKTKLPAATKERIFRRAQEIYEREFGARSDVGMAANARVIKVRGQEHVGVGAGQQFVVTAFAPEYGERVTVGMGSGQARLDWALGHARAEGYRDVEIELMSAEERERRARMLSNPPPRRGHSRGQATLRGRELPSARELIRREEARSRREERPFDPEERREHYAKPHHFAVNSIPDEGILRAVELGETGYRLDVWDTHRTDSYGKSILGYAFRTPMPDDEELFVGEDFSASPLHALDSDETLRALLGFLTLRPGDTDSEYFESYTPEQMAFAEGPAEELQVFGMEPDRDFEPPPLIDVVVRAGRLA